uniref:Uncharacterized protein n=1 Tax=Amphimedon queenslandica TaxID=400682 RepID=A0A1X7U8P8_AMPQE
MPPGSIFAIYIWPGATSKALEAFMVLQLKQKYKLSQTALNAVTEEFISLLQYKLSEVEESILKTANVSKTSAVRAAFQSPTLIDPFYSLHGKYQQEVYFSTFFCLQKSMERHLRSLSRDGNLVYDMSLLKSLEFLLSKEVIRDEVLRNHQRSDCLHGNYCESTVNKSHPLF